MAAPVITADFNNADVLGRLRLSVAGAVRDFTRLGIAPENGMHIVVADDDLEADGELVFSPEERIWVAKIDWNAIRRLPAPVATRQV
jgi:hypothetical protein